MNRTLEKKAAEQQEHGESIRVRVLFFGAARDIAGASELELDLKSPATAGSALEEILARYAELRRFGRSLLFAVNQEYAQALEMEVREGDELAVFPPVSGGGEDETKKSRDFFELTTAPIDVGEVARRV